MNVAHDMQPLQPGDAGYHWQSRARRCIHCRVNEAHADPRAACPVLLRQRDHQLAQVTVEMMSTITMEAGC